VSGNGNSLPASCLAYSYAKINLGLHVLDQRPDGYHNIETVMQSIDLKDTLYVRKIDSGIRVKCAHPAVPQDDANIVARAASSIFGRYGLEGGISVAIEKRIPVASGLAGGSGNAALALLIIARLWNMELSKDELLSLGRRIGADVPFQLAGGTWFAQDIGDRLTPVDCIADPWYVLVVPNCEVSTAWAYGNLKTDRGKRTFSARLRQHDWNITWDFLNHLENDFETLIFRTYPRIGELRDILIDSGARSALMSGSGPVVFGIFECEETARKCLPLFTEDYRTHVVKGVTPDYLSDMSFFY
jgi:4-diphosphocytidyl-2-C-methyl-D-erythritol kinase